MRKVARIRLVEARKHQHLSQQEVADLIGTTQRNVSRWELGLTTPGSYFRAKLCELFEMSAQDLGLFGEQSREEPQEASPLSLPQVSHPDRDQDEPLWHVPYPRNPFFTGREETLQRLHETLHQQCSLILSQSLAISGLGGIGKTQIALEYAYRYRQEYRFVFWVSAATHEALLTDSMAIADRLQLSERQEQDQQKVLKAVKRWFTTHHEWLLILDNADELTIAQDFVPTERSGHLLLTSRAQALGSLAQRIEIEKMGMVEATLFLLHRARLLAPDAFLDQAEEEHLTAAEAIAIEMDFLPLALDQAGAYIEEIGCSPTDYLEIYRTHRRELLRRRGHVPTTYPESVATTWSLSFQKIEQDNPVATELLRLCAFLEPDSIPEELLCEASAELGPVFQSITRDAFLLNEAMEELRKFSLMHRDAEMRTLRIHRLVQAVLKDVMEEDEQRRWEECIVRMVNAAFPASVEIATWPRCRRLLPQAQVCSALIQEADFIFADAAALLQRTASYLQTAALYEQAEPLFLRALQIREQTAEPNTPEVAISLGDLALLYLQRGKYEQAGPLFLRALQIWEQIPGSEHVEMASLLVNLGIQYRQQGRYAEAKRVLEQAVSIQEHIFGADHPDTASSLNALGNLYYDQRKYAKAESFYQRALIIRERHLKAKHPDVTLSLGNLGNLYLRQKRYTEAEPLLKQVLAIKEQVLGAEHPNVASALTSLGTLYLEQNRYAEAELLLQRAIQIWERALGDGHHLVAYPLNNLGNLYREQGNYAQAEPLYQRAIHIWEQALGPDHQLVASPLSYLGEIRLQQKRYVEAEMLLQRALSIWEQTLGNEHPLIPSTLLNLGKLYDEQGRYGEAEPCYQRAQTMWEQTLGPGHQKTREARTRYAELLRAMGREEEAARIEMLSAEQEQRL